MGWGNGTYISVPPITLRDKYHSKDPWPKAQPYCSPFQKVWPSMTKMGQNRKRNFKSLRYQGTITGNRPMNTKL